MRTLLMYVLVVVLVIANVMGDEMDVDKPLSMQTLFL